MSRGCTMTEPSTHLVLESREQLFSALGEAAELEHNLLCLYLYAAFSLKRTKEEGISAPQLDAVARWRQEILGIALEEMTHLVLVSNITVALGASPSFMRPNFSHVTRVLSRRSHHRTRAVRSKHTRAFYLS